MPVILLTVKEVAARLRCSERLVRSLCYRGELPYHRVSGLIRIDETDVESFLRGQKVGGQR